MLHDVDRMMGCQVPHEPSLDQPSLGGMDRSIIGCAPLTGSRTARHRSRYPRVANGARSHPHRLRESSSRSAELVICVALAVIAQGLQDLARGHLAAPALADHPLQFIAQPFEPGDLLLDGRKVP